MSDGPYRSLPMRAAWKKTAKFAYKPAFTADEICGAAVEALADDWRSDVPDALSRGVREILGREQVSLFRDDKIAQLESLRRLSAGHGLGQVLLDCAIHQAMSGRSGPDAAADAAAEGLAIWGARHARQIEEHFCRESTERRARDVRARIEEGIAGSSLTGLGRQLLKIDGTPAPRAAPKQTGLDDGARL